MLFVSTQIDNDLYAIDSRFIIEIIPFIEIRNHKLNENSNIGFVNYRGKQIPIIDLSVLVSGKSTRDLFSSRIIIAKVDENLFGLLSEQVTETIKVLNDFEIVDSSNLIGTIYFTQIIQFYGKQYYKLDPNSIYQIAYPTAGGNQ
jgi:chemotaxis-related protein WspB